MDRRYTGDKGEQNQTRCFNFPSIAVGSSSWSDSNGDLARRAFHGNGESSRTRVSSHLAGLASGAVPHYRRTDLQHSETFLPLTHNHLYPQAATMVGTGWSYLVAWSGVCLTLVASLATSASAIALRAQRRNWEEDSMRMKLRLNSMFAGHSYYPGAKHHSLSPPMVQQQQYHPSGYSPRGSRPPSIEPLTHMRANSRDSLTTPSTDMSTFVDYRKVVGELENSRF